MRPKVFISSTIYDFKDLRSALKYWIDEMGFEAVLSEFNDFNVLQNESSYDACLREIENCDYFILLIGSRAGGYYNKEKNITITMMEYRIAYELSLKGKIIIIPFVRRSIWDLREDRKALIELLKQEETIKDEKYIEKVAYHESSLIKNANLIFEFIKEVSKAKEVKEAVDNKTELPKNNWIHQFDSFEDIVKVLKVRLSLDKKLSEKILLFNLKNELENTLSTLFYYIDNKYISISEDGKVARKVYQHDLKTKIYLTNDETDNIILFYIESLKCNAKDTFISKAVSEGIFLEYDYEKKNFISTHSHHAATLLCEEIRKLNNESFRKSFSESYTHFLEENKLHTISDGAFYNPLYMFAIAAYSDTLHNITVLSRYLRNRIIDKNYKKGGFYSDVYYGKGSIK